MGTCDREEHDLLSGCAPNDDLTASILCVAEQAFTYSFYAIERMLAQRPFRPIEASLLGDGHIRPGRRKSRHLSQGGTRNQAGCKSCLDQYFQRRPMPLLKQRYLLRGLISPGLHQHSIIFLLRLVQRAHHFLKRRVHAFRDSVAAFPVWVWP